MSSDEAFIDGRPVSTDWATNVPASYTPMNQPVEQVADSASASVDGRPVSTDWATNVPASYTPMDQPVEQVDSALSASGGKPVVANASSPAPLYDGAAASYYSPTGPQATGGYQGPGISLEGSKRISYAGGYSGIQLPPAALDSYLKSDLTSAPATIVWRTDAEGKKTGSIEAAPLDANGKPLTDTIEVNADGLLTIKRKGTEESTAVQSLYKSPQFMAPVVSSVLNGLAQSFIAERMAKAQRDEQRRMLDAQFQLANAKEEADMAERRRVSKRYWELKKKQGYA